MSSNNIYTSPLCSCVICKKQFSQKGVGSHYFYSHTPEGIEAIKIQTQETGNKLRKSEEQKNDDKEKLKNKKLCESNNICLNCGNTTLSKFCSRSCSASYNNRLRSPRSEESKEKTSIALKSKPIKNQFGEFLPKEKRKTYQEISGEYTRVYLCICKFTGTKFYAKSPLRINPKFLDIKDAFRNNCAFKFSIKTYPEWFAEGIKLIKELGWYSTPGSNKNGIKNILGVSRDHIYSISDGFKNNIDPRIISHPANCRLISHKENQRKHSNSSITLEELKERIKIFESIYGVYVR